MADYIPVIGLEIHVELNTKSKMFCQCNANYFGKQPNTQTCPVCLGLPGALPVPNQKAIKYCQLIGLALRCKLNSKSKFDRKHYFYPDLPKGYQISQYDEPFCTKGSVEINAKKFGITRVHMEEDTGKLIHEEDETLIDFNRSGVPLVEIVTEPDFDNSDDVKRFLEELQVIIRYLGVSDADMEKGSMRLEPNISLRPKSNKKLPEYKVEVKNINSFKFVQKAIEYEIKRQTEILEKGQMPEQETRGFNEDKRITFSQRSKEYAHDYRYFPEPDIPPFEFNAEYLKKIKTQIPELASEKMQRFIKQYKLKTQDAYTLTRTKERAEFFEEKAKDKKIAEIFSSTQIQDLANVIINRKLTRSSPDSIFFEALGPIKTDLTALDKVIQSVIKNNWKAIEDYRNGKENVLMFLIGKVMQEMKGKADATIVKNKLLDKLKN